MRLKTDWFIKIILFLQNLLPITFSFSHTGSYSESPLTTPDAKIF